jgi:2-isopropylmalate synthase
VRGARRATVHLYNPIAPAWRRIVFNASREEIKEVAVSGTRLIRELTDAMPDTAWTYEYSPETFSLAELDFSLEVSDAVSAVWEPDANRPMVLNLPTTVECSTPMCSRTRSNGCIAVWRGASTSCCRCIRTTIVALPWPRRNWP